MATTYSDYPKERLDPTSTNEELVCFFCKRPEKEINDRLDGHATDCKYRNRKESEGS